MILRKFSGKKFCSTRGFTFLEVMVALMILAIGIIAVASGILLNMSHNTKSKKQTEAYNVAMGRAERLLALSYDNTELEVKGHPHVKGDGHSAVSGIYTVEWDVGDNSDVLLNSKLVSVIVFSKNKEVARLEFTRVKTDI